MYVPLHLHSQYSILDATPSVEDIAKRARELGIGAVALTDHGNMHGAIDFYKACIEEGIKPLIGCEVYVAPTSRFEKKKTQGKAAFPLVLIAKNEEGYHNLARLSSLGFLEGFYYHPRIDKELLSRYASGLICLSGCLYGQVAHAALQGTQEEFLAEIAWHKDLFGSDYYLELQRHEMAKEEVDKWSEPHLRVQYEEFSAKQKKLNHMLVEAGRTLGIQYVATNDTHYLDQEEWAAHEILLNIQSGEAVEIWEKDASGRETFRVPNPKRRTYPSRELYFKTPHQMAELFHDIPEAISATVEVAAKCDLHFDFKAKHYPLYIPPSLAKTELPLDAATQAKEARDFLRSLCEEGIARRYTQKALEKVAEKYPGVDPMDVVRKRLEFEFNLITSKAMSDYLLIVWDFIDWAKKEGIPVGPGRGSGAGSIILYLIGVTDIEPLRFHLFFERFINPERISYPDIDVDICMSRREEVIAYTLGKYGKHNVAQIITFGTMKAKMTIKDVGRTLSIPLSKVNAIAKLVPEDPNMTLEKALETDVELHQMVQNDPDAKKIIELGMRLEGSIRNTGIHAAGIIISAKPLMDHIPVCLAKDSQMLATQYSMKPVEAVGMLKIDFLGLKTLTSIKICVDCIRETLGTSLDWVNLPLEDLETFKLLHQGRTLGVFQMESQGMQELARQLQPDRFEEIIAIGALYRPGPMDMIPSFISRKHGREPIEYDHPLIESILSETYGIMVYQEQVMQIATQLAGYSLGQGDVLRRAMGKKDAAQMAKEREKFREGAVAKGISEEVATAIFDKMEKFASYGFNKSHAAAYGYLTYVTAYLKANFPGQWMAALMTCDRDDVSKIAKFIRESAAMGLAILPPDVNEAGKEFLATAQGIRFAMTGIKGIGEGIVDLIFQERKKRGRFLSFYDFFKRMEIKKVGKKTIECLVHAGCFDFTGWSRDALCMRIEEMYDFCLKNQEEASKGVLTFFSLIGDEGEKRFLQPLEVKQPTPPLNILKKEKELLGFFLTGHPLDNYRKLMGRLSCVPFSSLEELPHNAVVRVAFIVEDLEVRIAQKTQRKFAILTISDGMESFELPIWSELYEAKGALLEENQLLYAVLQIDRREENMRLSCQWLDDLTQVNEAMIEECDKAFDRAKFKMTRFSSSSKPKEPQTVKESSETFLKVDLRHIKLSHILQMKALFKEHPGSSLLKLEFYADTKCEGALHLSSVHVSKELLGELRALPGVT